MKIFKFIANFLLLIFITPNFVFPYHIEDSSTNMSIENVVVENQKTQELIFAKIMNLIDRIEKGDIHSYYRKGEIKRVNKFLALLAKKGKRDKHDKDSLELDKDIQELCDSVEKDFDSFLHDYKNIRLSQLYHRYYRKGNIKIVNRFLALLATKGKRDKYDKDSSELDKDIQELWGSVEEDFDSFLYDCENMSLSQLYHRRDYLVPKRIDSSFWQKPWKKTKNFVKKNKKYIIIGAVVVAAVTTVACVISAKAAAVAAGGIAGGVVDKKSNSKKNESHIKNKEDLITSISDLIISDENISEFQTTESITEEISDFEQILINETKNINTSTKIADSLLPDISISTLPPRECVQEAQHILEEEIDDFKEIVAKKIADYSDPLEKKEQNDFIKFISECTYDLLEGSRDPAISLPVMGEHINKDFSNSFQENIFYLQGQEALNTKHYDKAIDSFRKAIEINPQNHNIYLDRAFAYLEKREFNNSLIDYQIYTEQKNANLEKPITFSDGLDFSVGVTTGITKGAIESGKQLILFAAKAITHPIDTGQGIYEAFANIAMLVHSQEWKTLSQVLVPEVCELINEWDSLLPKNKGEKSGYVFGKYGADIFIPGATIKIASQGIKGAKELAIIAKNLQKTEKIIVLEALAETGGGSGAFAETISSWKTTEKFMPHSSATLNNIKKITSITTTKDILNIIKPEGKWIGKKGSNNLVRLFKGSQKEGMQVFNELTKSGKIIYSKNKKIISKLSDEIHITYRPLSKSGPPTIDINIEGFERNIKLKFMEN